MLAKNANIYFCIKDLKKTKFQLFLLMKKQMNILVILAILLCYYLNVYFVYHLLKLARKCIYSGSGVGSWILTKAKIMQGLQCAHKLCASFIFCYRTSEPYFAYNLQGMLWLYHSPWGRSKRIFPLFISTIYKKILDI